MPTILKCNKFCKGERMKNKTNILLITSDQQHWNTLGLDNPEIKTPCLDKLAKEGTVFNRAYTCNPTCTPTRASIITGQYPSQHGAWSLGTKLSEDVHTVGEDFQKAGYRTGLIGKAHFQPLKGTNEYPSLESYPILQDLDYWKNKTDAFYGFEHIELARNHADEAHVGQHYAIWMEEKGATNWREWFRTPTGTVDFQEHKWHIPEELHYNNWIAERTNAKLEEYKNSDENFFLWASFFDPHPPYLIPEPWDTMYDPKDVTVPEIVPGEHDKNPVYHQLTQTEKPDFKFLQEQDGNGCHGCHTHLHDNEKLAKDIAIYYGMISCMDKYIARIVDQLDALGLAENTLIVFTSDHGHYFGQHGLIAKGPFHYEDGIKVPYIVRQPGKVPAGKRSNALQSLVDFAPSFLSACDVPVPRTMTGVDQTPVWYNEKETIRDHVICENRHQPTTLNHRTYINDRYKLTVFYGQEFGELYDLRQDPGEINNLWDHPDSQSLKAELFLKYIHAELGKEPLWMPRIAGA